MKSLRLSPPGSPLDAVVSVPGSKSLTNRAIVAAAMADGTSILSNALFADDTRRMLEAVRALGFAVTADADERRIEITGCGGHIPAGEADLDCGNSGTTIRFCTALSALGRGRYRMDGSERMRERPIGQLVDGLRALGAGVEYHGPEGFCPLTVYGNGLAAGTVAFDRLASSQFVSAVLLAAPAAGGDVLINVEGRLTSAPYVAMTTALMRAFGPAVIEDVGANSARWIVPAPQAYGPQHYAVEPDASNASYFLAAPAVAGGRVSVEGLGTGSVQGDAGFVDVLEAMGCAVDRSPDRLTVHGPPGGALRGIDIDLNDMPDMVQTLAVLALFAEGETVIRNVANLRVKETDRLGALAAELTACGAEVVELDDGLRIGPPGVVREVAVNTYDDHRMAMSFALAGLREPGVVINDPGCVAKTFPDFFQRWEGLYRSQ